MPNLYDDYRDTRLEWDDINDLYGCFREADTLDELEALEIDVLQATSDLKYAIGEINAQLDTDKGMPQDKYTRALRARDIKTNQYSKLMRLLKLVSRDIRDTRFPPEDYLFMTIARDTLDDKEFSNLMAEYNNARNATSGPTEAL